MADNTERSISEYLDMLITSMEKKSSVLDELMAVNGEQDQIFDSGVLREDALDELGDRKGALIDRLESLDDGFESVYDRISAEIKADPKKYASQVGRMKELVREVTDKSARLGAAEARQKEKADRFFENLKKEIRDGRKASKTAFGYYQSMKQYSSPKPNFFDIKN